MNIHTQTIAPSIRLHCAETDRFTTRLYTILLRRRLSRGEVTANAMLPGILKRGCAAEPEARGIQRRAEDMYGAVFGADVVKKGEEQLLQFCLETTRDVPMPEALAFLRDIILQPLAAEGAFHAPYVEAARAALRQDIDARANDKRTYACLRCLEEMCGGEPFGIYGDGYAADLDALTAESLFAQYNAVISRAPVEILVVGDMPAAEAAACAASLDFPRGTIETVPAADYALRPVKPRTADEPADVAQGKLCIGLRTGLPPSGQAYYDLLIANAILGGGGDSKLFAEVREKAQLCYYVHSILYRFKSILIIECGVAPRDFGKAEALVAEQIGHMREGAFTTEELEKAKRALTKLLRGMADAPSSLSDFILSQTIAGETPSPEAAAAHVEAVTAAGCCAAFAGVTLDTTYRLTSSC